jgi:hypothetical protein
MKKPSIDPALIFGVSFVLAVALSFPTLRPTLHGDVDIADAGIRFFFVLALSWAGVYVLASIVGTSTGRDERRTPPPPPADEGRRDDAARHGEASNAA